MAWAGYSRVWVVNATAYHFESQTRVAITHPWEHKLIKGRWLTPEYDPYVPHYGRVFIGTDEPLNRQVAKNAGH